MAEHVQTVGVDGLDEVFEVQKRIFVKLLDYMDSREGGEEEEVERERRAATVVVNPARPKGCVGGQLLVQDLETALKLVRRNGGTIFLEAGDYYTDSFWDLRQQGREVRLVGAGTGCCSLRGAVRVEAETRVRLERLKVEVGQEAESEEAVHVVRGELVLDCCLVEITSNTAFYLQVCW